MKIHELIHNDLELRVKKPNPEGSFLRSVVLPKPVVFELDNLSAEDANRYLAQRKLFDKALRQSQLDLQKLAST